ncbi:hypothetical protein EK904_000204 [Melospiza melodia maxima]|nr:hypothetical protein EK904_000204 [Melospiza melodia maxima]
MLPMSFPPLRRSNTLCLEQFALFGIPFWPFAEGWTHPCCFTPMGVTFPEVTCGCCSCSASAVISLVRYPDRSHGARGFTEAAVPRQSKPWHPECVLATSLKTSVSPVPSVCPHSPGSRRALSGRAGAAAFRGLQRESRPAREPGNRSSAHTEEKIMRRNILEHPADTVPIPRSSPPPSAWKPSPHSLTGSPSSCSTAKDSKQSVPIQWLCAASDPNYSCDHGASNKVWRQIEEKKL